MKNYKKYTWLILASITWSWLWLVDVGKISNSAFMGYLILLFGYLLLVGLTTMVAMKAVKWLKPVLAKSSWQNVLKLLIVWAAVEFFIAWAVSVVWMGRNGNWDNQLPFYSLTPLIMMTPLKFLARLLGYFGTSAVIGTGVVILYKKNFRKYALAYWAVVIVLNGVLWGIYRTPVGEQTTVTIVSERLGSPQQIQVSSSQFVLLPEYGLDDYDSENISTRFASDGREVYFSGTKQVNAGSGTQNVLVYGSNVKGFTHEQAKSRLITAGEYMPFGIEVFVKATNRTIYDDFMIRRGVVRGSAPTEPFVVKESLIVGNAACSSIIHPDDYRRLTQAGATVLANSASLEIFRGSRLFGMYHDGLAKFMATANARPFLQSANNWKAFALDHNGSTLAGLPPTGSQEVTIQTNTRKTPYTFLCEWVALLGGVFIAGQIARWAKRRWRTRP